MTKQKTKQNQIGAQPSMAMWKSEIRNPKSEIKDMKTMLKANILRRCQMQWQI